MDGYVECGDGFVADDEFGFHGERARNADALSPTAVEFVRVDVHVPLGESDDFHEFEGSFLDGVFPS